MRKLIGRLAIAVGICVFAYYAIGMYRGYLASNTPPTYSEPVSTPILPTETVVTAIPTETAVQTAVQSTLEPTQPVSQEPVLIQGYNLNGMDLSAGQFTAMSFVPLVMDSNGQPVEKEIASTWAKAIGEKPEADIQTVFEPAHEGTIYSYWGDTLVMEVHSGQIDYKPILFGSNLDLYLRIGANGQMSLAEGQKMVSGLIGRRAYFCQQDNQTVFTAYYPQYGCSGKKVELEIVAGTLLGPDLVNDFYLNRYSLLAWTKATFTQAGFEKVNPSNGMIFFTCVGKYQDQPDNGIDSWVYNRAIFGFKVVQ